MTRLKIYEPLAKLTKFVYNLEFPTDEKFNLESQIKRAVVSIRLNLREGNAYYNKIRNRLFNVAKGSLVEVDECMIIMTELKYIKQKDYDNFKLIYWECLNKLNKLITSISQEKQK